MSSGRRSDDDHDYYAEDIGTTYKLDLSTSSAQTSDAHGALPEGRYRLQLLDGAAGARAWIGFVKFEKDASVPTVDTDTPWFPMDVDNPPKPDPTLMVRKGYNDRPVGLVSSGTATLFLTLIARDG